MFTRTVELIGNEAFQRLQQTRVILFGTGGVGGWCAEALLRTGITHLTLVDYDTVAVSNLNRQVVATQATIGQSKVEAMRDRLLSINPDADLVAVAQRYGGDDGWKPDWHQYDIAVDAIDMITYKAQLLYEATAAGLAVFSAMGAARKTDCAQVQTAEFQKVYGCPLARAVRHRMKHTGLFPQQPVYCVFSPEQPHKDERIKGSIAPVVGSFGMHMAGLVIRHILRS